MLPATSVLRASNGLRRPIARSLVSHLQCKLVSSFWLEQIRTFMLMDIQLDQLQLMLISMFREDVRILCLILKEESLNI